MMQPLKTQDRPFEDHAQLFKLMAHPVRLAILDILRDGEHCVCHMEAYLGYRQAYISQQLAQLREACLIQDRRDGWNIFYSVTDARIFTVMDIIHTMTGQPDVTKNRGKVNCSCPHCTTKIE